MQSQATSQLNLHHSKLPIDQILDGTCIELMQQLPSAQVDFIVTDPPYLVNYRDRNNRTIQNDTSAEWLKPAFV